MENKILHGDSLDLLKDMDDNSVDSVVTDPPYGYSFMGKDWDKALPPIDIWKECVRVLKPGAFAFVMSAPRSDVHSRMCLMLEEAGFRIDFTPIAWTYATGFPKASNIGKMVDKRLGKEREKYMKPIAYPDSNCWGVPNKNKPLGETMFQDGSRKMESGMVEASLPESDKAKELDGSYGGFQPKPAWENVIVCMKPLSEKGYLDQAMKDGKGITWLDGCRIPLKKTDYDKYVDKQKSFGGAKTIGVVNEGGNTFLGGDMKQLDPSETYLKKTTNRKSRPDDSTWAQSGFKSEDNDTAEASSMGRFPANLLVQDDVLNNGTTSKSVRRSPKNNKDNPDQMLYTPDKAIYSDKNTHNDEGSFSRYYDLDAWWEERIKELPLNVQATYPFIIVPKASKAEKNKGLDEKDFSKTIGHNRFDKCATCGGYLLQNQDRPSACKCENPVRQDNTIRGNFHPTVKPISLMSYLVTLGSREDELVLDPFVGSGTTCIAAKLLNRKYIGMEMDSDYVVIAQERIKAHEPEKQQHDFF